MNSEKRHSWTWHGITHILLSQQDQSGSEDSEKEHSWTWMESLTSCQANITRVAVRIVRRHTAGGPGMESLTPCQANSRTRVSVRTVRRDIAGPGMECLTY